MRAHQYAARRTDPATVKPAAKAISKAGRTRTFQRCRCCCSAADITTLAKARTLGARRGSGTGSPFRTARMTATRSDGDNRHRGSPRRQPGTPCAFARAKNSTQPISPPATTPTADSELASATPIIPRPPTKPNTTAQRRGPPRHSHSSMARTSPTTAGTVKAALPHGARHGRVHSRHPAPGLQQDRSAVLA